MFKKLALVLAAASCVALSGCGEEKSQSAPAAPQKAASADAGVLKAAWLYPSPRADEGWSKQHDDAREIVQKKFGDKIQTQFVENVTTLADAEIWPTRATRSFLQQASNS